MGNKRPNRKGSGAKARARMRALRRPSFRNRKRRILSDLQRGVCWLCGDERRPMTLADPEAPDFATFDEVTPQASGGKCLAINQAMAHRDCNHARGCAPATPAQLERLRALRMAARPVESIPHAQ